MRSQFLDATKIPLIACDEAETVFEPRDLDPVFDPGTRVRHRVYGVGTVTSILPLARNDDAAEVKFDRYGLKRVQTIRLEIAA